MRAGPRRVCRHRREPGAGVGAVISRRRRSGDGPGRRRANVRTCPAWSRTGRDAVDAGPGQVRRVRPAERVDLDPGRPPRWPPPRSRRAFAIRSAGRDELGGLAVEVVERGVVARLPLAQQLREALHRQVAPRPGALVARPPVRVEQDAAAGYRSGVRCSRGKVITASPASGRPPFCMMTITCRPPSLTARWIVPGVNQTTSPDARVRLLGPVWSRVCSRPRPPTTT